MEHSSASESKAYAIPLTAHGRTPFGTRLLAYFATYSLLMLFGFVLGDLIFKSSDGAIGSSAWAHHTFFKSLFFGAGMTLSALGKEQRPSGLEIRNDSIVLYEGQALDPVYRNGRLVPTSEIRDVHEVRKSWFRKQSGIIVFYGRRPRWFTKRFYVPSATPDYSEIREQLMCFRPKPA